MHRVKKNIISMTAADGQPYLIGIKRFSVSLLIILVFTYLFYVTYDEVRQKTIDEFNIQQSIITQQAATGFENLFMRTRAELIFMSYLPGIIKSNPAGFHKLDVFMEERGSVIMAITRMDSSGNLEYATPHESFAKGKNIWYQKKFQNSERWNEAIVSEYFETADGFGAVILYVPVIPDSIFLGSLAVLIQFEALTTEFLKSIQFGNRTNSWLVSKEGIELYCTTPEHVGQSAWESSGDDDSGDLLLTNMLSKTKGVMDFEMGGVASHAIYRRIELPNTFWAVAVASQEHEILAAMKGFTDRFIQILLLAILSIIGFYYLIFRAWNVLSEDSRRKKMETALKDSEALKSAVLDNSPIGISVRRANGELILVNRALKKILNMTDEEMEELLSESVSFSFEESYAYLGEYKDSVIKVYKEGGRFFVPEVRPRSHREKRADWISQFFYAIMDANGQVDKVVVLTEDISQRKRDEQEIMSAKMHAEENEARYRALHNASFGGIGIHDNGLILDCNQGLAEITGYSTKELIGMNGLLLIASQSRDLVKEKILSLDDKPYEATGVRKNGEEFQLRIEERAIPDEGKLVRVTEFRDITSEKENEAARAVLETQLRQSQKLEAVGTMVGGIAHELNNVLQSMFLYGDLVSSDLPVKGNTRDSFNNLLDGAEKARDIVKQILTFSRKSSIDLKPQSICGTVMEAILLERASFPANIEIKHDIDKNCGAILCDKTQINQIVINLCNNAQQAMQKSGGTLTVSLKRGRASLDSAEPEIEVLELEVADTGHGISPKDLEQIFDPFYTTKELGEGTGLGLSVIHGIVETMGGRILVTSELNNGTSFKLLFPIIEVEEEAQELIHLDGPTDNNAKAILLVDDEESIRKVSQMLLTSKGFDITCAANGREALDIFIEHPGKFNLIVTDFSMPEMSGLEFSQAVRESGSTIPIILSTGHLGVEEKIEYRERGISYFLSKPWTAEQLLEVIGEIL